MTSSNKKKKQKKSTLQKVKLKLGRRLPKGGNITDLSFKAKKIFIKDQLKSTGTTSEPTTKRKLKITDLLTRLQHHNLAHRKDALEGLREIISDNPELTVHNLREVLEYILKLMADKESVIRAAVPEILKAILNHVTAAQVEPFFPTVSAFICYAMTNIDNDTQADSLATIDVLLGKFPQLFVNSSNQILSNFLNLISHKKEAFISTERSISKLEDSLPTDQRSLLVNPVNKLCSQMWRVRVIQRLEKVLKALHTHGMEKGFHHSKADSQPAQAEIYLDHSGPNYIRLYQYAGVKPCLSQGFPLTVRSKGSLGSTCTRPSDLLRDSDSLKHFVKVLMPLLMEMWVEAKPDHKNSGSQLSAESMAVLASVTSVTRLLYGCVHYYCMTRHDDSLAEWFHSSYQKDLLSRFMTGFPYSLIHRITKKNKKSIQVSEASLNVGLCDVFTMVVPQITTKTREMWGQITEYLQDLLTEDTTQLSLTELDVIATVVRRVAQSDSFQDDEVCQLLESAYQCYTSLHPLHQKRGCLLQLFLELTLDHRLYDLAKHRCGALQSWMAGLVDEVCSKEPILPGVFTALQKLAPRQFPALLTAIQDRLHDVIDNVSIVQDRGKDNEGYRASRALVEMTNWAPCITAPAWTSLTKTFGPSTDVYMDLNTYLLEIISTRIQTDPSCEWCGGPSMYVNFLFSAIIGIRSAELKQMMDIEEDITTSLFPSLDTRTVYISGEWEHYRLIQKRAVAMLWKLPAGIVSIQIITAYLRILLTDYSVLPIQTALGIINLMTSNDQLRQLLAVESCRHKILSVAVSTLVTLTMADMQGLTECNDRLEDCIYNISRILETLNGGDFVTQIMLQAAQAAMTMEHAQLVCHVMSLLLMGPCIRLNQIYQLQGVVHQIQEFFGEEIYHKEWFSSIVYELSMRRSNHEVQLGFPQQEMMIASY